MKLIKIFQCQYSLLYPYPCRYPHGPFDISIILHFPWTKGLATPIYCICVLRLNFDVLLVHLKAFYFELICCSAIICVFSSHTFILLLRASTFIIASVVFWELPLLASCRNISSLMVKWKTQLFKQTLELTSEVFDFLRGIFNMFDINNVSWMHTFSFL